MTELTQDLSKLGMEDFKKRFDPDLNVNDFSAVHEAYQYLVVEYVEKVIDYLYKGGQKYHDTLANWNKVEHDKI